MPYSAYADLHTARNLCLTSSTSANYNTISDFGDDVIINKIPVKAHYSPMLFDNEFEMNVENNVVKIHTLGPVRSLAALAALQDMLTAMALEDKDYTLEGKELSKVFPLRFN